MALVLRSEDRIDHPPDSVSRCRELIAVAVSQIDGDPIVGDRLVDPALEITVAHFKKIIALQRAGRRNPVTHENAEDLTANVLVGRSVRHRSTIRFARHRSYGRTATVDKIAQPRSNPAFAACPLLEATRTWSRHHFGASPSALPVLADFYPSVFRLTGRTFKSAFAQVRSSLNHADKPHRFTARWAARAVGDKHH